MKQTKKTRRQAIKTFGAVAAATIISGTRFSRAADPGSVVVSVYGGEALDAMRKAMFQPFTKATGIKVIEATGPTAVRAAAMVASGNIEWDVVYPDEIDAIELHEKDMLEKIDYTRFDKSTLAEFDPDMIRPYAIAGNLFGYVMGWNTKKYSHDSAPKSWANVWDIKNFPGPRVLTSGLFSIPPNEAALMADNVPHEKLYPLDLDRSYKMLRKIKPSVVKWTTSAGMVTQALIGGEADLGMVAHGTTSAVIAKGAPLAYDFNQGIYTRESWTILKGTKNYDNAMKFIVFASQAEQQAAWSNLVPYGTTNKRAISLLPEDKVRKLVSYPDNLNRMVALNADWWKQKDPVTGKTNIERNDDMWHAFTRS